MGRRIRVHTSGRSDTSCRLRTQTKFRKDNAGTDESGISYIFPTRHHSILTCLIQSSPKIPKRNSFHKSLNSLEIYLWANIAEELQTPWRTEQETARQAGVWPLDKSSSEPDDDDNDAHCVGSLMISRLDGKMAVLVYLVYRIVVFGLVGVLLMPQTPAYPLRQ